MDGAPGIISTEQRRPERGPVRWILLLSLFIATALAAQQLKPGMEAPPIAASPLDGTHRFPGWEAYRGKYVVVDFWATWCAPCLVGLEKEAALEKEFAGQPVRFMTVATDEMPRVKKYFAEKGLTLETYVDGDDGPTAAAYGVHVVPAAAVVDRDGHIVAVTPGGSITAEVLHQLLNGEKTATPAFERANDLTWDKDQINWEDGVQPTLEVLIKPISVAGGGYYYVPGSNRISGDGVPVSAMTMAAWQTDSFHMDIRNPLPKGTYRFAVVVPKEQEAELLPMFQDALERNFGFQAHWEEQERQVLVLSSDGTKALPESTSDPLFQFERGKITFRKQPSAKLAEALPNWLKKTVVNETGLSGTYDFDLDYVANDPKVLTDELQQKYGIAITPAKRKVRVLVVERPNPKWKP